MNLVQHEVIFVISPETLQLQPYLQLVAASSPPSPCLRSSHFLLLCLLFHHFHPYILCSFSLPVLLIPMSTTYYHNIYIYILHALLYYYISLLCNPTHPPKPTPTLHVQAPSVFQWLPLVSLPLSLFQPSCCCAWWFCPTSNLHSTRPSRNRCSRSLTRSTRKSPGAPSSPTTSVSPPHTASFVTIPLSTTKRRALWS